MKKLGGQLQRWCKQHGMKIPTKKDEKPIINSEKEKLSRSDIEELMGRNKRVYRRGRGGALRQ